MDAGERDAAAGAGTSAVPASSAVPDILAADLRLVLVGINPGRVSAAAAAHFANPRNDFWRLLHAAGLTPRLLEPQEQEELLELGIGVTNAALRTTPGSGDLHAADFADSAARLEQIARQLRPAVLAFVGKEAYRGAFGQRPALGLQDAEARRHPAVRAALDLAGQRRGPLGRTAPLVPGACLDRAGHRPGRSAGRALTTLRRSAGPAAPPDGTRTLRSATTQRRMVE